MFGEERSGLEYVELQQDLQHVENQENPLRVGDHRIRLVQTNEHGVHQDDQIVSDRKGPEKYTKQSSSVSVTTFTMCFCRSGFIFTKHPESFSQLTKLGETLDSWGFDLTVIHNIFQL